MNELASLSMYLVAFTTFSTHCPLAGMANSAHSLIHSLTHSLRYTVKRCSSVHILSFRHPRSRSPGIVAIGIEDLMLKKVEDRGQIEYTFFPFLSFFKK